ncbi:MAG: TIM barrel protein [Planctomycetota bacterium]|jgi:sugar phosphate isomerase/epimerase|nr:TIM barrel protein [Planctomycetota bacterium]
MRAFIHEYLKFGIVHFKAFPQCANGTGPISETLTKICEDAFFAAVEVGAIKDVLQRTEAARILAIAKIEVAYGCQPTLFPAKLSLNHLDQGERRKAVNAVFNCLREAHDLGARSVRIPAGKDPGPEKRGEAKKLLIDSLHKILERAKQMGDPLVTLKIFDRDIDKESLIGPCDDALEIAKELSPSHPNFGLLTDLSHYPLLREKPEDIIPRLKPYLKAFHIGNCVMRDHLHPIYGDLQPRFGVEGGEIDTPAVADFFRVLKREGLIGPEKRPVLSAEVRPLLPGETSGLIIANCKRTVQEAWALA